jgi:hypothetical protein
MRWRARISGRECKALARGVRQIVQRRDGARREGNVAKGGIKATDHVLGKPPCAHTFFGEGFERR